MFETFSLFTFKCTFHVFICATFFQYHKSRKNVAQVAQNVTRLWKKSDALNAVLNKLKAVLIYCCTKAFLEKILGCV